MENNCRHYDLALLGEYSQEEIPLETTFSCPNGHGDFCLRCARTFRFYKGTVLVKDVLACPECGEILGGEEKEEEGEGISRIQVFESSPV